MMNENKGFGIVIIISFWACGIYAQESQRDTDNQSAPFDKNNPAQAILAGQASARMHAPESPGDTDLGEQLLLQPVNSYRALSIYASGNAHWTSNAALTESDKLEDFFWRHNSGATFLPHLTGNLYGEISGAYGSYHYADNSDLDFEALDTGGGLVNIFPNLGNLSLSTRYNYTRYSGNGEELFSDHSIEIAAFKPIPLGLYHYFYFGWESDFSVDADPGYAQRHEHSITSGYHYSPAEKLSLEIYYRFAINDYDSSGRTDLNHTVGAAVGYHLRDNLLIRAAASFVVNDSDMSGADYQATTAGATAGIILKF